ncbi:substrate-binding domain-containing protein [Cellulomonas algicola]|uniref:D-ribose ABC transporter substrate-binding protein n=1 Tax=Cellulomonas algicola TaxID=2071633 RepID=A0A401UZR6_9CELL|nr:MULTISPECIES: substrate-binding domain-containing protein [Cellulomonas]GCD20193.1 D-ribose ABC transporter substrate-binding protein [Cellulomonas algicola]
MKLRIPALAAGLAATTLVLGACGAVDTGTGSSNGGSSGAATAASGEIPRPDSCDDETPFIAVALPNLTNPYYVAMKAGFEEAAEANGFTVEVQIADDDDANQLAQAQSMLQKKPCALALNAVKSEPGAAIVKAANDAGVPVFTVNVGIDPEALESQGASIVQYLGADNTAGGRQTAEQVLADLGADAEIKVGFVTEPDETPTQMRDAGFEEALSANPNASVVAKVDGNVKPDDSLRATTEMLSGNPDINVIFASTGPAAYGALQALGANSAVKVYGFCASEQTLTEQYPACVAQEPNAYGQQVVEQIRAWVDGATPEAEILQSLKLFTVGQTPGPGEVG